MEVEMTYQAIYNYWFQEIAPVFWIVIVIYVPISFILFPIIWNISKYRTNKKNDRELKNKKILSKKIREKFNYYENKIRINMIIIKHLNSENRKFRIQRERHRNIDKEDDR